MDLTWIAPALVLGLGAGIAALVVRLIVGATEDAAAAHRRLRRLEDGLIPLRVETRRTRDSLDRIHRR